MTQHMKENFGLPNLGNTCYLNSAVQLLCLNDSFLKMENIRNNPSQAIKKIKSKLANISSRFSGFQQQDSGEALILLLEEYGKHYNILKDYEFTEITRVKCKLMRCLHQEITNRKSNVLLLDIVSETLDDCYRNLKNAVKLKGDEAWKCPKCEISLVASKRFYFEDWSKYLIIGLKRFEYKGTRYVKNSKEIEVPLKWRHGYELRGAIIHSGSINGGHYICVGKRDNKWYLFNDSSVSMINSKRLLESYLKKAYFFLYQK